MKCLTYSFSTFPDLPYLKHIFPHLFVFHNLKQDFKTFTTLILDQQPDFVLGIAKSRGKASRFEPLTINTFNKTKRVERNGKESYLLFIPQLTADDFAKAQRPTDSFCNWTMYKLAAFIDKQNLPTRLMFIHLSQAHLKNLAEYIQEILVTKSFV